MKNRLLQLIALTLPLVFIACSDEEDPAEYAVTSAIAAPESITLTSATTSSLSFEWTSVPGAVLYGYELVNSNGKALKGGTTTGTSASFTGLNLFTNYTINVVAIPRIGKGVAQSAKTSITATTLFYDALDNSGYYYSNMRIAGAYWTADITEDRSADDYKEGWFGVFTISKFYNKNNYDLVFTVNPDYTIKVVNSLGYADDANHLAIVATGWNSGSASYLKTILIDEASSVFDYANRTLSYNVRTLDNASQQKADTDIFEW